MKDNENNWNGTINRTIINEFVHEELFDELRKIPSNSRSKRLVLLASVGLVVSKMNGGSLNIEALKEDEATNKTTKNVEAIKTTNNAKNRLLASLDQKKEE